MKPVLKLIFFLLFLFPGKHFSQNNEDAFQKKSFVILFSGKEFGSAFTFAKKAAAKLNYKFEEKRVKPDSSAHLSFQKTICETEGFGFPCYVQRGRYDDGAYISIEYSDYYEGFAKGYYLVIAASGKAKDPAMKKGIKKIKTVFPKSYTKETSIYIGCIH